MVSANFALTVSMVLFTKNPRASSYNRTLSAIRITQLNISF